MPTQPDTPNSPPSPIPSQGDSGVNQEEIERIETALNEIQEQLDEGQDKSQDQEDDRQDQRDPKDPEHELPTFEDIHHIIARTGILTGILGLLVVVAVGAYSFAPIFIIGLIFLIYAEINGFPVDISS